MSIQNGFQKVKNYILQTDGYKLLSRWTSSHSVEFDDGKTAETKLGAINGLVKTANEIKTTTDDSFVPSATAVKDMYNELNSNLLRINFYLQAPSSNYNGKPWLVLKENINKIPAGHFFAGTINAGTVYSVHGFIVDKWGSFVMHSYSVNYIYHIFVVDRRWYVGRVTSDEVSEF